MRKRRMKWNVLALCMAAILIVTMLPTQVLTKAETINGKVEIKPISYDIGENAFNYQITTSEENAYIAYYVYNGKEYNYTMDELFNLAKETTEQKNRQVEVKVSGNTLDLLYVALISAEGDLICSHVYDSTFYDRLLRDDAESIEYVNGTLDDVSAEVKNGKIIVKDSSNQSGEGSIYAFSHRMNGGEWHGETHCYFTDGEAQANISDCISGSGEYLFKYFIVKNGVVTTKVNTVIYNYTKPTAKLDPVNISTVKWKKGILTIPGVDQNSQLMGKIIEATIYRSNDNEQWLRGNGRGAWLGNQDIELDLNDYIKDYKYYKVGIVVKSNDIDNYLNSDEVFTDIYDTTSSSEEVNNTLKDVLVQAGVDSVEKADADTLNKIYNEADETKKAEIAKALRDGLKETDTATLRTAMQTNSDTRATVEAIEKMSGITVANDVSEDVKAYIDTANIKVLGAALNADDGVSNVGLKITKEADVATLDSKYKNAIPLGITLTNVSTAASGLAVPVTITIPVPRGIDISKLVILHMNADGTVNENFSNGNGYSYDINSRTITFTVTHFSTFIFAEADETNTNPENPTTPENPTSPANPTTPENPTTPGSSVTNPTTTAELAQSQATETDNTASATAETVTSSPKTGDNGSMAVLWVLFAGCAITAFCYAKKRVRR
jgi:hypothetical protein